MASRERKPDVLALATGTAHDGVHLVRVISYEMEELRVQIDGDAGPVAARVSESISDDALRLAASERQEALAVYPQEDPGRPIVLALLRSRSPLVDALLAAAAPRPGVTALLDGEKVVLEAKEEVVLRCGKASITLKRDGRVLVRGVNVVTQADQVQKIRGGKVQIN